MGIALFVSHAPRCPPVMARSSWWCSWGWQRSEEHHWRWRGACGVSHLRGWVRHSLCCKPTWWSCLQRHHEEGPTLQALWRHMRLKHGEYTAICGHWKRLNDGAHTFLDSHLLLLNRFDLYVAIVLSIPDVIHGPIRKFVWSWWNDVTWCNMM